MQVGGKEKGEGEKGEEGKEGRKHDKEKGGRYKLKWRRNE